MSAGELGSNPKPSAGGLGSLSGAPPLRAPLDFSSVFLLPLVYIAHQLFAEV
jgi:hypothetical protein